MVLNQSCCSTRRLGGALPKCSECANEYGHGANDCGGNPCEDPCGCGVCGSFGGCTSTYSCKASRRSKSGGDEMVARCAERDTGQRDEATNG